MFGRQKVALMVGEFLGAAILSMVTLSMIGRTTFPFFVAAAAAVTFGTMAYLFGAHSNPAVTAGLWVMRKVQTTQAIIFVGLQMLGGLAAWQLCEYLLNSQLRNIAGSGFDWRVLIAEALGAFVLGLGVAVAVNKAYTGVQLAGVMGVSLFLGILVATFASNGLLNPAVAVGVQSWNWSYAVAPFLGTVVGMGFYGVVFTDMLTRSRRTSSASTRTRAARTTVRKTTAGRAAKKPASTRRKR